MLQMKKRDRWSVDTIDLTTKPKEEKSRKKIISWFMDNKKQILIVVGVMYLLILLFGIFTTRFYTDENGERRAYQLSFSDLRAQDDYNALTDKMSDIRSLLTDITIIDIHVANGDYGNYEAATYYTDILNEQLDVLIPKISAMNLQDEQKTIQEEMENILSYDLALYLQNMATGLKNGSNETVSTALAYRDKALTTYELIESDLKLVSDRLKMNDSSYYNWVLKDAVAAKDKTAVLAEKGE